MNPTTDTTPQPSPEPSARHRRRRTLLSLAIVGAIAFGGGAATAASVTSDGSASPHTKAAAAMLATDLDVQALWTQLSAMPASERDNVVAGLSPDARGQLRAYAQEIATASENR